MDQIGRVLDGRYVLEQRLGSGAMGVVYRGRRQKLGRAFAIKILHDSLTAEPALVRRFEQEAEIAGKLCHHNVVQIIDFGRTDEGTRYTVMELVIGDNLTASLGSPMASNRVISLVRQMLDGLQHAHEAGLIHRDFKPDNVIIEVENDGRETPRIVDFGIAILRAHACSYESKGRFTTMGVVLGTPEYMAPEQARGLPIDHRADLFALGVTCYQMLTGKLPFDGSGLEIAVANMSGDPPPMRRRMTGEVDPLLEAFTRTLMARNPDDRPQSARAARTLLDLIERDRSAAVVALGLTPKAEPVVTTPLPVIDRCEAIPAAAPREPRRGHRAPPRRVAAGACLILAAVSAVSWAMTNTMPSESAKLITIAPQEPARSSVFSGPERVVAMASLVESPSLPAVTPPIVTAPRSSPRRTRPVAPRTDHVREVTVSEPARSTPEVIPPAPPASSASGVATLYITVGQDLAELSRARGPEAARDLWTRYRRLRINETFTTEANRSDGAVVLSTIKNEIARRTNRAP